MIKTLTTIITTRGSIITIKVAFFAINPLKLHKYYFESRLLNWVTGRERSYFITINQSIFTAATTTAATSTAPNTPPYLYRERGLINSVDILEVHKATQLQD